MVSHSERGHGFWFSWSHACLLARVFSSPSPAPSTALHFVRIARWDRCRFRGCIKCVKFEMNGWGKTERASRHIGIFPFNACVCLPIDIGNNRIAPYVYDIEVDGTPLTFWCMSTAAAAYSIGIGSKSSTFNSHSRHSHSHHTHIRTHTSSFTLNSVLPSNTSVALPGYYDPLWLL